MKSLLISWDKIYQNVPILTWTGAIHLIFAAFLVLIAREDQRVLNGELVWIKPIKFAVSIAIFCWTIAIIIDLISYSKAKRSTISYLIAACLLLEMFAITFQAARGVPSHFNISSTFDQIIFMIMGVAIGLVFVLTVVMYIDSFRLPFMGTVILRSGVRWGIFSLIIASIVGGMMSAQLSHSVGNISGGGDLRVAHFFGIHGLQILPFFAYLLVKHQIHLARFWINLFGVCYIGFVFFTLIQACQGQALIFI